MLRTDKLYKFGEIHPYVLCICVYVYMCMGVCVCIMYMCMYVYVYMGESHQICTIVRPQRFVTIPGYSGLLLHLWKVVYVLLSSL